jgi:cytochrome c
MPHRTPRASSTRHFTGWAAASLIVLLGACGGGGDPSPGAAGASASREAAANVQGAPVYRFAKISTGAYFYTGNQWEADNIRDTLPDFRYEGIAFYQSDAASGSPVYRFANLDNGGYFYTASAWERDNTITNYPNMRYEGSTFSVAPAGDPAAAPVYRVANLQNGAYLYTTNPAERDAAVALGFWRDEGSTFAARTTPNAPDPGDTPEYQAGLQLAQRKNCMACHAVDKKLVGPSFQNVAIRYRGQANAAGYLSTRIRAGGSGVWGAIPMPANAQVTPAEADALARWVLSIP